MIYMKAKKSTKVNQGRFFYDYIDITTVDQR